MERPLFLCPENGYHVLMDVRSPKIRVKAMCSRFWGPLFFLAFIAVFSIGFVQDSARSSAGYSIQEALRVIKLIDMVQLEQLEKGINEVRKVAVTESELNSYIAYRIDVEKEEIMRELVLKLFDDNKVEGKIFIDLRGQNLPKILRPQMTFYMGGKLEVENGKVRLELKDLFLESQRIQPAILDLVIFIGSKIQGTESFSMSDWWDLPYGIKDMETRQGKAIFYY
jgi:hypothetical protein